MPFLSIIVPIFNAADYLERCVESILRQEFSDFELILVDDGSEDGSGDLCDKLSNLDSRIKVIHQQNKGLVNARRQGVLASSGEYITFVDADDYLIDGILRKLYVIYLEHKPDILVFDFYLLNGIGLDKYIQKLDGGFFCGESLKLLLSKTLYSGEYFLFGLNPAMWNKWIKKELFKNSMEVPDEIRIGEDVAYVYPMMFASDSIYYAKNEYGYVYRIQDNSMTQVVKHREAYEYAALMDYLWRKLVTDSAKEQMLYYGAWMLSSYIGREKNLMLKGKISAVTFFKSLHTLKECSFTRDLGKKYITLDGISTMDKMLLGFIYKNPIMAELKILLSNRHKDGVSV